MYELVVCVQFFFVLLVFFKIFFPFTIVRLVVVCLSCNCPSVYRFSSCRVQDSFIKLIVNIHHRTGSVRQARPGREKKV